MNTPRIDDARSRCEKVLTVILREPVTVEDAFHAIDELQAAVKNLKEVL